MFEQRKGTGTMFPNDYKTSDNHPDWKGKYVDAAGKEWQVGGWDKQTKNGKTFISFMTSEPYKKDPGAKPDFKSKPVDNCPQPEAEEESDELPF